MGILGIIWFTIVFFIKFVLCLVGLVIVIPLLFVTSGIICFITGTVLFSVCFFLDKHTNIMEKLVVWLEAQEGRASKWFEQFKKHKDTDII